MSFRKIAVNTRNWTMLCQIACYKHKELNLRQFNKICCERRKSAASVENLMLLWQQFCLLRFAMLLVCFALQCCLVWLDCFVWLDFVMSSCLIHFVMLLLFDSLHNVVSQALLSCSSCYDSSYASSLMTMLMTMLMTILRPIVNRSSREHRLVSKSILFRVSLCSSESYR